MSKKLSPFWRANNALTTYFNNGKYCKFFCGFVIKCIFFNPGNLTPPQQTTCFTSLFFNFSIISKMLQSDILSILAFLING